MRTRHLIGLLIAAILLISTAPLYAQREQQNITKLKADARNLSTWNTIGDASNYHSSIAMTDQNDVPEVFLDQIIDDGFDSLDQSDAPRISWTIALDCGRERRVTGLLD